MNESRPSASLVTTRWSMVLAAGQSASPDSQKALAALCQVYWPAVYVFVRRQVRNVHDAQDLTQAFFMRMLEKNALAVAHPERGRFRSFLLTSVKHFLHNEWDKQSAQKRGGGQQIFALDFQAHDSRCSFEPADAWTPERMFERQWALSLLDGVMLQLRDEYARASKTPLFDALKGTLSGGDSEQSHAQVALRLGISENAAKVAAHRLRKRYRELLRAEVAQTLHEPQEIDDEIRQLFTAFQG